MYRVHLIENGGMKRRKRPVSGDTRRERLEFYKCDHGGVSMKECEGLVCVCVGYLVRGIRVSLRRKVKRAEKEMNKIKSMQKSDHKKRASGSKSKKMPENTEKIKSPTVGAGRKETGPRRQD